MIQKLIDEVKAWFASAPDTRNVLHTSTLMGRLLYVVQCRQTDIEEVVEELGGLANWDQMSGERCRQLASILRRQLAEPNAIDQNEIAELVRRATQWLGMTRKQSLEVVDTSYLIQSLRGALLRQSPAAEGEVVRLFDPKRMPVPHDEGWFSHPDLGPIFGHDEISAEEATRRLALLGWESCYHEIEGAINDDSCDYKLPIPLPEAPAGDGWLCVSVYDTEDGPYAHFVRPAPTPPSANVDCTRSHPHENMSPMCELRTEIARLNNQLANAGPKVNLGTLRSVADEMQSNSEKRYINGTDHGLLWWAQQIRKAIGGKV